MMSVSEDHNASVDWPWAFRKLGIDVPSFVGFNEGSEPVQQVGGRHREIAGGVELVAPRSRLFSGRHGHSMSI